MKIEWRPVFGYEDIYEVSNNGKIKSNSNWAKGKELCPIKSSKGYYYVHLTKNAKVKTKAVHRLVAAAFYPTSDISLEVNHKNGIKTDNRAENLEFVTSSENKKHAILLGLYRRHRKSTIPG